MSKLLEQLNDIAEKMKLVQSENPTMPSLLTSVFIPSVSRFVNEMKTIDKLQQRMVSIEQSRSESATNFKALQRR